MQKAIAVGQTVKDELSSSKLYLRHGRHDDTQQREADKGPLGDHVLRDTSVVKPASCRLFYMISWPSYAQFAF